MHTLRTPDDVKRLATPVRFDAQNADAILASTGGTRATRFVGCRLAQLTIKGSLARIASPADCASTR